MQICPNRLRSPSNNAREFRTFCFPLACPFRPSDHAAVPSRSFRAQLIRWLSESITSLVYKLLIVSVDANPLSRDSEEVRSSPR
ncbi:hypothetical protein L596_027988 [Steinernema carpocapsae]|uniref:Uncharacterized protein n=1 Tax=Steinernema carpocapsae TaxID=34508 RepID=A0A4U5LX50_STECR|nr:hypothetical protein L596_027988 [Steinernema carpocapsae]